MSPVEQIVALPPGEAIEFAPPGTGTVFVVVREESRILLHKGRIIQHAPWRLISFVSLDHHPLTWAAEQVAAAIRLTWRTEAHTHPAIDVA